MESAGVGLEAILILKLLLIQMLLQILDQAAVALTCEQPGILDQETEPPALSLFVMQAHKRQLAAQ
jgi:hypothetical protein